MVEHFLSSPLPFFLGERDSLHSSARSRKFSMENLNLEFVALYSSIDPFSSPFSLRPLDRWWMGVEMGIEIRDTEVVSLASIIKAARIRSRGL